MGMIILPTLVKKITYKPDSYPFVYYSCLLDDLCLINHQNKKAPMKDTKGNVYTTAEFDSLIPTLNYRQLMVDGRLPDSIKGVEISPKILRATSVNFKYSPRDFQTPTTELYLLFEAMPKRVGLEMPNDVFRLKDKIEFIDSETNQVNQAKSDLFQKELEKAGYKFPTQWASGNPNPRKPYEEGYFALDANGNLFHIKMVNERPYVKDTKVGQNIDIAGFEMLEVPDKRFYGFLFSKKGEIFIIENENGYRTLKLDIDPINLDKDQVIIMGNMFDWTVSVITPDNKICYALDCATLKRLTDYTIEREIGKWDKISKWMFPYYLSVENSNSDFISPQITVTGVYGFITNFILAIFAGIFAGGSRNKRILSAVFTLLTGIAGLIALLLLPNFRSKFKYNQK